MGVRTKFFSHSFDNRDDQKMMALKKHLIPTLALLWPMSFLDSIGIMHKLVISGCNGGGAHPRSISFYFHAGFGKKPGQIVAFHTHYWSWRPLGNSGSATVSALANIEEGVVPGTPSSLVQFLSFLFSFIKKQP